jgi:hypothetical protein
MTAEMRDFEIEQGRGGAWLVRHVRTGLIVEFRPRTRGQPVPRGGIDIFGPSDSQWIGQRLDSKALRDASNGMLPSRLIAEAGDHFRRHLRDVFNPFDRE